MDNQKLNNLKADVYDLMVAIENHSLAIQELQKQVGEVNKHILEEQNKIAANGTK